MGTWFWLNIPLGVLFFCCWTGIPLWFLGKRWNAEVNAKHAEIAAKMAAKTVTAPGLAQPDPVVVRETDRLASVGAAAPPGR